MTKFQSGDLVRSLANKEPFRKLGDVFVVDQVREESPYVLEQVFYNYARGETIWGDADEFELIARAGEPVRYQPGDVVEFVSPSAVIGPSWSGNTRLKIGYRYTLCDPVWAPPSYFKLVHRPAKSEPLVFTPPEPQVGDRVRVTYDVYVRRSNRPGPGSHDLEGLDHLRKSWNAKIEIIERAEKPLAVGDRVQGPYSDKVGVIRYIAHNRAAIEFGDDLTSIHISDLGRAK